MSETTSSYEQQTRLAFTLFDFWKTTRAAAVLGEKFVADLYSTIDEESTIALREMLYSLTESQERLPQSLETEYLAWTSPKMREDDEDYAGFHAFQLGKADIEQQKGVDGDIR